MSAIGASVGHFHHVDWRLLAVAVAFLLLGFVCHARAWANLLQAARPDLRVPRGAVLCAHLVGVAGNAVIPAHVGDAAKIALVRRAMPGTAIATIVTTLLMLTGIDIVLGGGALLVTASTSLGPTIPQPSGLGLLIPVALVLAAGAAAVVARPRLAGVLEHVRQGAALLRNPGRFLREAVSWQVGAWLARVAVAFVGLHAFGLPASLLDALLVVVATGIAGAIPFLPGGVGAQQAMLVYALRKTASAASVIAFGVGMQVGVTLIDLTVGLLALMITFRTFALRDAVRDALRASRRPA